MKLERAGLIGFLGNYLVNTVVAALVSLVPSNGATGYFTPQYMTFVVLAVIVVALLSWWSGARGWKAGLIFGLVGLVIAIASAFVTGLSGVLAQTGSLSSVANTVPAFWPFLWNPSTAVLAGYWLIPAVVIGWWRGRGMMMAAPKPMGTM